MIIDYMDLKKTQAIQAALTGDWKQAININQSILQEDLKDIKTLNRLAFAQSSIGNIKEAKELYGKVLELDKQNPIALRNLKRLSGSAAKKDYTGFLTQHGANLFIEEPGKTKVIELINIADKKVTAPLRSGEKLILQVKRMKIFVLDIDKQYIGMFPDDISKRLIEFINGGNEYEAYVKTVDVNKAVIFTREVKRAARFLHQSSFNSTDKTRLNLEGGKNQVDSKPRRTQDEIDDDKESVSSDDEEVELL